jgi:hypothetical protein
LPIKAVLDFFRQFHAVDHPLLEIPSADDNRVPRILKPGLPANLKPEPFSLGKCRCFLLRQSTSSALPITTQILQVSKNSRLWSKPLAKTRSTIRVLTPSPAHQERSASICPLSQEPDASSPSTAVASQVVQLYQQGNPHGAIPLAQKALEICKQALGERHPNYATSLNNLAGLYYSQHGHTGNGPCREPTFAG